MPAASPVAGSSIDDEAVGGGEDRQQRRRTEQRARRCRRARAPARRRGAPPPTPRRARGGRGSTGSGGRDVAAAGPAHDRHPDEAEHDERRARVARAARSTGTPSHSASSVGLPGLIASPWHQMPGAPSAATASAVSSRPPTEEPAETTTTSAPASGARERRLERRAVVGDDPARHRLAARLADERGEGDGAGVAHLSCLPASAWPGRTTSSPVERIATRGRACTGELDRRPAAASSPRSWARSGRPAGTSSTPVARVLVGAHDPVAGRHRAHDLDRARHRLLRVLDHDDGVRAGGQDGAGGDRHSAAGHDRDRPERRPSPPRRRPPGIPAAPPTRRTCRPRAPRSRRRWSGRSPAGRGARAPARRGRGRGRRRARPPRRRCGAPGGIRRAPRRPCGRRRTRAVRPWPSVDEEEVQAERLEPIGGGQAVAVEPAAGRSTRRSSRAARSGVSAALRPDSSSRVSVRNRSGSQSSSLRPALAHIEELLQEDDAPRRRAEIGGVEGRLPVTASRSSADCGEEIGEHAAQELAENQRVHQGGAVFGLDRGMPATPRARG